MLIGVKTRILIIDSSEQRLKLYRSILSNQEFEIQQIANVVSAFELFMHWQPALVILDLKLCLQQDADLIGKIKRSNAGEVFTPLLLASDESEETLLDHALAKKADGFLKIPFTKRVLMAKISSLLRIRELYTELKENRDKLQKLHISLQQEHKDAERIYDKFVRPSSQEIAGFKSYISAASIFNGDLLLARVQPSGDVVIMLGDFTGHGLSAAIGVIPVAEMFNGMIAKARGLAEIIVEINTKLHRILPAHLFFGCAFIQVSPSQGKARIYNFGMPDILMRDSEQNLSRFPSTNLPLGIVESRRLDLQATNIELDGSETFYMFTDGVLESRNSAGDMFGYHRIEQIVACEHCDLETLIQGVSRFCGGEFFEDDISIAELKVKDILQTNYIDSLANLVPAASWKLNFCFDYHTLKNMKHPIEGVVDMMMQMQPIPSHKERLFLVLDELFNNALDHGVLELDSSLKQQEEGFLKFLTKRHLKLESLSKGFIEMNIQHRPLGMYEGEFIIKVHDSGQGFNYHQTGQARDTHQPTFSGRGVLLVKSLCHKVEYQGKGNAVKAIYRWSLRPTQH